MSRHERFSRGLTGTSRTVARRGLPKKTVSHIAGLAGGSFLPPSQNTSSSVHGNVNIMSIPHIAFIYFVVVNTSVPQYIGKTARRRGTSPTPRGKIDFFD